MKPVSLWPRLWLSAGSAILLTLTATAQDLSDGLVAYWPLDTVEGDKTPDLVHAYNMSAYVGASHTLTNANAITLVAGHKGKGVSFDNANQVLLGYTAGASDELPINKQTSFTIAFWMKGAPNQADRRLFSEGNTANNNPLFNIGSNASAGMLDLFFRQQPSAADLAAGYGDFGGGAHLLSVTDPTKPFDNDWHLVTLVQNEDGSRILYIDGVPDALAIAAKPAGKWNVNATSIGGIFRSTAGAWVTAVIDDVALWKRALSVDEIAKFKTESLDSVFPPLGNGLVAYWPMDTVQADKTPDRVNGYDLSAYVGASHTLTNGNGIKLVAGYKGKAASFDNANQILLGYVAGANDQLPINKYPATTINFWMRGAANQSDRRLFSEGNTGNNNPLFNIGSNASGGMLDLFFRQQPSAADLAAGYGDFGGGAHLLSVNDPKPFDASWHMVTLIQQEDGSRILYIDGVADALAITAKPAGKWNVNATGIGGILRSTAGAWVTADIDEVSLWKRALTAAELEEVRTNGLNTVFPPLAEGLVSHWPMDSVQGDKSPDLVSGYDLAPYVGASHTLTNGNAIKLVAGKKGSAVSFDNANQVLLGYAAGANDDLPINKQSSFTVSFWMRGAPNQADRRIFSEGNLANNNPLFNIGSNASGGMLDFFFRQQPSAADLAAGFGDFGGGAHLLTNTDPTKPYDNSWHLVAFVQNEDGTRVAYIDGVPDGLALPVKPSGKWNVNATSVGGILRSTAGAWVTADIDEVAAWKRALSIVEIEQVRTNGIPRTFQRKLPLQIRAFLADRPTVVSGDTVRLHWEASEDATLTISPGVGDVTAGSAFGVGETNLTINSTTTYTLTASRGAESTNATVTVTAISGIATGWRLIDNFEFLNPGWIGGQGNWQNALTSVSGAHNPANVLQADGNKILGFSAPKVLAATALNSMTILEGKSNTLFFRFYIPTSADNPLDSGIIPDIDFYVGLTEKGLRDVQDFRGGGNGPSIHITRSQGGTGGPIDLQAVNGPGGRFGTMYSWVGDTANNPNADGLKLGTVYSVWMDVENLSFGVSGGVQSGGDHYSLYVQKEGDANRTNLFLNLTSDRDGVAVDPVLGGAGPNLTHLYFTSTDSIATQGTNTVRFDDFFLSKDGFLASAPASAGTFLLATEGIRVHVTAAGQVAGSFAITWNADLGQTFTVEKRSSLSTGAWTQVTTAFPTGGASDTTVSFTDTAAGGQTSFYRISSP